MKNKVIGFLVLSITAGIAVTGCGKEEVTQIEGSTVIGEETDEVTIIEDNGEEVVNELLEEEQEDELVDAEIIEEEEEKEPIIPQESKEETEEVKEELPVIDPVTEAEVAADDVVVDVSNLNGHQENMLMLMDAMNMCLAENGYQYDVNHQEFFWNAINYAIMTYPEVPEAQSEEMLIWAEDYSSIQAHEDLIKVYAEGMFADYQQLPELPRKCMVTESEQEGYYYLSIGDRGSSYGEIVTWVEVADGSCHVEARLAEASSGDTMVSYVYELVVNQNEKGSFKYRIKSAKPKEIEELTVEEQAE